MKKARVKAVGGIFFRCANPAATRKWYSDHLGLNTDAYGTSFQWYKSDGSKGFTAWNPSDTDAEYFGDPEQQFMVNYRVDDLELMLEQMASAGIFPLDEVATFEYGKFVHVLDPDGRRIELWEPNDRAYDQMIVARSGEDEPDS
jgi:catechol 2,3-dioxygenase-like lactoylglutathione lyase family enzyme